MASVLAFAAAVRSEKRVVVFMAMVECENLVKIYKTRDFEVLALQGLDLTVEEGELIAVIGNSGSGKSTLLNMLGGLDRPSAGRLIVDNQDLLKMSPPKLILYKRRSVGFVWQSNARNLIPYLTAQQNVELPMILCNVPWKQRKERTRDLLERVNLHRQRDSKLFQLSGGEQQRVAIAISLANQPRLLLADEPTGSVDQRTSRQIYDLIRDLNQDLKLTVIIVTHDRQLAKTVSRVVMIRDGRTSSEFLLKQSYSEQLAHLSLLGETERAAEEAESHEELVVLDRSGRLQLPREYLAALGITGRDMMRAEFEDGRIVLLPRDRKAAPGETAGDNRHEPTEPAD
jgi:ABC-type lipoprotein export system ATPase subunit